MHPFDAILDCLPCGRSAHYDVLEEQPAPDFPHEKTPHPQTTQALADEVLKTLYDADIDDEHLRQRLQGVVRETGWYDSLVALVFNALEKALRAGVPMIQPMKDASEKAERVIGKVWGFVKEHPVFFSLLALGILVILVPWAVEVLGFGELGPIEGTFAARWQLTYAGYVPAKSLFSFFQRLGMVWRRKLVTSY